MLALRPALKLQPQRPWARRPHAPVPPRWLAVMGDRYPLRLHGGGVMPGDVLSQAVAYASAYISVSGGHQILFLSYRPSASVA